MIKAYVRGLACFRKCGSGMDMYDMEIRKREVVIWYHSVLETGEVSAGRHPVLIRVLVRYLGHGGLVIYSSFVKGVRG